MSGTDVAATAWRGEWGWRVRGSGRERVFLAGAGVGKVFLTASGGSRSFGCQSVRVFGQHFVDTLHPVRERRWVGRVSALQLYVANERAQFAFAVRAVEVREQELAHRAKALGRGDRDIIQLPHGQRPLDLTHTSRMHQQHRPAARDAGYCSSARLAGPWPGRLAVHDRPQGAANDFAGALLAGVAQGRW
jgi:hypothetical protein